MTTQYGFFIDSARCTGCKTCELACKDYKNLTPEVSVRRIYEYAGGDWLEELHELFGNAFLIVVLAHLALIALLSVLRRQNQALPMLTGRLPGSGPSPVRHNRSWLAGLLLLAVLAFGAWQWQDSPRGLVPGLGAGGALVQDGEHDD